MDPATAEYLSRVSMAIGFGSGAAVFAIRSCDLASRLFSEKITSQRQLDALTRYETEKLGMTEPVVATLCDEPANFTTISEDDTTHLIDLYRKEANTGILRHELYHAYKDHHRKSSFFQEVQAIAYAAFGMRL